MSSSHFLGLEEQLKDRLRAGLDAALMTHVRLYSVTALPEGTLPTPSLLMLFDGYSITERSSTGKHARISQNWLVFVCTRSAADIKSGEASRSLAGAIADVVLTALMGWQPDGCTKPLQLTNPPKADYDDGFFYLPVAVEAELLRKTP